MKNALLILLVGILYHSSSFAWTDQVVEKWDDISKIYSKEIPSAEYGTFWGGLRRAVHWNAHRGGMISIRPEGFRKELPVYLSVRETKSDLYIFYPGVFGRPDGKIAPQVIDAIEEKDVHVVTIPNLLAPTYLVARPKPLNDGIDGEKKSQRKILLEIMKLIPQDKINKIHIIAESLGCTQALTTLSPSEESPLKYDSLTLMWPPLYLNRSVKRFDELIMKSSFKEKDCSYWWKWPMTLYETKYKSIPNGLSQEDKGCFGAWVVSSGFVGSIEETAAIVLKENSDPTPIPHTFEDFVRVILPELYPAILNKDKRLTVSYLLQGLQGQDAKIRLVSSQNDFLNEMKEWEGLKSELPNLSSEIYLFPWGGHSGPAGMDGFIEAILFP